MNSFNGRENHILSADVAQLFSVGKQSETMFIDSLAARPTMLTIAKESI